MTAPDGKGDTGPALVTTEWSDEADGAHLVICREHGVIDYGSTEAAAELKAAEHAAQHESDGVSE